ncbi:OLC1v1023291C1 [Oldenlandia corymbosa var. corymbosa]|uniref:OLC1v1023291C1 n=1 Tax=Oldenlandia corymbosa var. corymbosa TaxID=529605 RepID=A0AAV1C3B3_OLDCO|nr:OLC1v1023291C1 [Oldenlandia corymbosa var. corymbosa]
MDDSNIQQNNKDDIDGKQGIYIGPNDSGRNVNGNEQLSENYHTNLMKYSLLLGAEKVLMARNSPPPLVFSDAESCPINQDNISAAARTQGKNVMEMNEKDYGNSQCCWIQSRPSNGIECRNNDKFIHSSNNMGIDYPSNYCNEFPLDFVSFLRILAVLVLKLAGFQIAFLARLFTFPIQIINIWTAFLLFPFHLMAFARDHLKKKLLTLWSYSCFSLIYFICDRFKMRRKSVLKLAVRFCWASFWAVYVCLILVGMLVLGFVIGGVIMKNLVVEPIQTTQNLNFDYTKSCPVSFVPIASSPVAGISPGLDYKDRIPFSKNPGGRPIPYNHKLKLTVSLTIPESEYNRNLGIFQVKVESLSMDGKVTGSSSYPTMLKFKSQPIRFVETTIKSIPLLTGFQSEVQNLKIEVNDYMEGHEPTVCFKVSVEQRAEFEPGFGIPEIYSATLHIESRLPQLRRLVWNWRRTIFVWISIVSFLTELMISLICFRAIILPGKTVLNVIGAKGSRYRVNKISW